MGNQPATSRAPTWDEQTETLGDPMLTLIEQCIEIIAKSLSAPATQDDYTLAR